MKVNHTAGSPVQANEPAEAKGAGRSHHARKTEKLEKGEKSTSASRRSRVSNEDAKADISPRGKEFAKVREAASDTPDVREDKIAELKARMSAGSYRVDPHAIADRLVDEHLSSS